MACACGMVRMVPRSLTQWVKALALAAYGTTNVWLTWWLTGWTRTTANSCPCWRRPWWAWHQCRPWRARPWRARPWRAPLTAMTVRAPRAALTPLPAHRRSASCRRGSGRDGRVPACHVSAKRCGRLVAPSQPVVPAVWWDLEAAADCGQRQRVGECRAEGWRPRHPGGAAQVCGRPHIG